MTNYQRIQIDKEFCAHAICDAIEEETGANFFDGTMKWLDTEQREVNDEHKEDVECWPDWKKRAALCNYEFGKEDL